MGKLMDDVSVSELMQMRAEGMTFAEMGKALGVSSATIQNYCPHDKRQRKDGMGDEIRRLAAEGLSQTEIAKRLGVAQSTVSYQMRKQPGKVQKVDFSERRKKVEAQYNTEPKQEPQPQGDAGEMLNGFVLSQTVEIGTVSRKYVIHRDKDGCNVILKTDNGELALTLDDLKGIAAECRMVCNWVEKHPKMGLEVV